MPDVDNKKVAKNAIALTVRMVLVTIVGLYTSRIVLEALGVDDYGIYGVVGGVVGMASFLNSSMMGATSRFITFEMERGNQQELKGIFSTSLLIHFGLSIIVVLLAETIGLWFLNHKMVFPPGRMFAVNVLYQFTIVSMIVNFTQVPYTAAIIAHEKMNIYAYFEIINVVLKLVIVYILLIVSADRLILYAALMLCVSVITAMIYRAYCVRHFSETKFRLNFSRKVMHEMLVFSGYDLYGNMCVVANTQGIPIILNIFFGVIANTGASIATTVTGVLKGFSSSIMQAFRPQIIKLYASNEIDRMRAMMIRSVQLSLLLFGIIAIPIVLNTSIILNLWLGQVPEYAVEFIKIIIVGTFFNLIVLVSNTGIHATGNIRNISFISGSFFLLNPILSWFLLKYVVRTAELVYIVELASFIVVSVLGCYFLYKQIPGFKVSKFISSITRSIVATFLSLLLTKSIVSPFSDFFSQNAGFGLNISGILITGFVGAIILCIITLLIAFNSSERHFVLTSVHQKIKAIFIRN